MSFCCVWLPFLLQPISPNTPSREVLLPLVTVVDLRCTWSSSRKRVVNRWMDRWKHSHCHAVAPIEEAHEWSPEGPITLEPVQHSALKLLASHGTWTTRLTHYMFRLPLVRSCPYFELSATSRSVCGFLYCSGGYFFTNHSLLYHSKQLV